MSIDDTHWGNRRYRTDAEDLDYDRYRSDKIQNRLRQIGLDVIATRTIMVEPEIQDYYVKGNQYSPEYMTRPREYEHLFTVEVKGRVAEGVLECVDRVNEFERKSTFFERELQTTSRALGEMQTQSRTIQAFLNDNPSAKDKWDELVVLAKLSGVDLVL